MVTVQQFCQFLEAFAPRRLAEDWDNVGLLIGDRNREASNVMTCLTITPESVAEAIAKDTDLIVAHHPLPFRPLKRITADFVNGAMLLQPGMRLNLSNVKKQLAWFQSEGLVGADIGIDTLVDARFVETY